MQNQARSMPRPADLAYAERVLVAHGFEYVATIMSDDAKKDGVTDFGKLFTRKRGFKTKKFYLNLKTIGDVQSAIREHDAGKESDLPEWLRP